MQSEHNQNIRMIKLHAVISKVGLSKPTIYSRIREGKFPRPVKLGPKSVAWVEYEIDSWLTEKMQARSNLLQAQ